MDKLPPHFKSIKIPTSNSTVHKEECAFSFDTPDCPTGLYVCLSRWLAFGRPHVEAYSRSSGNCVFLHLLRSRTELPQEKKEEPDKKIARLAIGVEGGFNPDANSKKYEYSTALSVVVLPDFTSIPYPNEQFPTIVTEAVEGIQKARSARKDAEQMVDASMWDGDVRAVSAHAADLLQLDNGTRVPPSGWQCSRCDKTDNLWLNLTDGVICCGRRQLDGSGGNDHAVLHYEATKYPLSVKLGTITKDGKGDVFSYPENDMVEDPNLVQHLAHWGINCASLEKTEKTMSELEIEMNSTAWEYSRLTESGQKLVPVFGPGYTGFENLGNSCYINSVLQTLFTVPSFVDRYYTKASEIFSACSATDADQDLEVQLAKIGTGLLSGRYSTPPEDFNREAPVDIDSVQKGIAPYIFRHVMGKNHAEFSTKKQQDVMEFFEHMLTLTEQSSKKAGRPEPGHCFKFKVSDRFECGESHAARYVSRSDVYLPLPVPMSEASNTAEVQAYQARKREAQARGERFTEEAVRASVPFAACLSKMVAPESITAHSSAVGRKVEMSHTHRLLTFPDYLLVQLVKFGISPTWEPFKFDVSVEVPEELDLSCLRGEGPREGEKLMPEDEEEEKPKVPEADPALLATLQDFGFTRNACLRALASGCSEADSACSWLFEHANDADINSPLPDASTGKQDFTPNAEALTSLISMGFDEEQCIRALKATNNAPDASVEWLFNPDNAGPEPTPAPATSAPPELPVTDGAPKYQLTGFVSHMGSSVHVGHYVCHLKKDGQWTIFNDNKVSRSVSPPLDLGYLYLYKRTS